MNNNIYADKIKKHRRLKFGAFAVGLTAAVIALIVIINVVFSSLASKFMWYADMTKEQIYGITQQSVDLLDDYRGTKEFGMHNISRTNFARSADPRNGASTFFP